MNACATAMLRRPPARARGRVALLCAFAGAALALGHARPVAAGFSEGDIIVRMRPKASAARFGEKLRARGVAPRGTVALPGVLVVDGGATPHLRARDIARDPDVAYAVPNRRIGLAATFPNDPLFGNQWHLHNTGQAGGTADADIDGPEAWEITTGSQSVILGIVDTGIDLAHPDLMGRLWVNPGEIPNNGLDDDGNGFVDDVNGWNFRKNNNDISATTSHGTAVAAAAATQSNNATGAASVDWACRVMVVNVFDVTGFSTEADAVNGVLYAIDNGARVVNASWGSGAYSPLQQDMAAHAREKGVLIVAAAGNYNFDSDTNPFYPAAHPLEAVLAVGGSTRVDGWIYNYGASSVGITAPAFDVYVPVLGGGYGFARGTSFASPLTAGVACLLLAQNPSLTPLQLKHRIMAGADHPSAMAERNRVSGRLNAHGALSISDAIPPDAVPDLAATRIGVNGAEFQFTAPGDDGGVGTAGFYEVRVTTGPLDAGNFGDLPDTPIHVTPAPAGSTQRFFVNALDPGVTHRVAVRALDEAGNAAAPSNVVTFGTSVPPVVAFADACDTTHPTWTAVGFELAPPGYTGELAWQDSPGGEYTSGSLATLTSGDLPLAALVRPRLHYRLIQFFPPRTDQADRLEVLVSVDSGVTWIPVRRHRVNVFPWRLETVPLDDFATATHIRVRFSVITDTDNNVSDGVYIDDIALADAGEIVPEARSIVLEAVDFFGLDALPGDVALSGTWQPWPAWKSRAPGVSGRAALRSEAGTTATARFVPLVTTPGVYEVSVSWGVGVSSPGAAFRVASTTGTATLILDQTDNPDRWIPLGRYHLAYGRNAAGGSVELDASPSAGGQTAADAVRFRLVEPVPPARVEDWRAHD